MTRLPSLEEKRRQRDEVLYDCASYITLYATAVRENDAPEDVRLLTGVLAHVEWAAWVVLDSNRRERRSLPPRERREVLAAVALLRE